MNAVSTLRATLLAAAIATGLAGCSDSQEEMSQEEIQYLSHLDQSRFFQRQGELKASTQEARSAIELQPERAEPYFVILNNLLTAGDAVTTERQLDYLLENLPEPAKTGELLNEAQLIKAEAALMKGETGKGLSALDQLESPDRIHQRQALLLKGRLYLSAGEHENARDAFSEARDLAESSVAPIIGLSRVAHAQDNNDRARELIAEAEEKDPQSSELWLWKAQLAENTGQWQEAEEAYIKALEDIGRFDIMTHRKYQTISSLVRVLREQGKASEAFVYEEILAKSGPGTIKSNMSAAQEAFESGDYRSAIEYLEEVLTQAPGSEQARLMLGMIRFRQGDFEEAEKLLGPIADLGDSDVASRLVAASRLQLRDPEGAQAILDGLENKNSDPSLVAMAGIASLATGDRQTGETLLRKAIEMAPENTQLRLRFARYLIEDGRPKPALAELDAILKTDPDSVPAKSLKVQAHLANGDQSAAKTAADAWVKAQPANMNALMTRGNLAANLGNFKDAVQYFDRAAKAAPDNATPQLALARAHLANNNRDAAKVNFRKAADLAPNSLDALRGIASLVPTSELLDEVEALAARHPEAIAPKLIQLEYALRENNQTRADELTASLMERESEGEPAPAENYVALIYGRVAAMHRSEGDSEQAARLLSRGRALFPENEDIALQAASVRLGDGEETAARKILSEVKSFAPDSPRPYLVEASYHERENNLDQAAELYQLAIEKNAGPVAKVQLVNVLQKAGRIQTAIETAQAARESHPEHEGLAVSLAMLYQQDGQTQNAIAAYERALRTSPDNAVVLNNLSWLYYEQDDSRALELAERAYKQDQQNAAIADTYGWILFKNGDQQRSVPVLEKAHQLAPESRDIALHLAEAYRATGQNSKAKAVLMKFENQEQP